MPGEINTNFPPDVALSLEEAARRKAMAQALLQQSLATRPTEMVSGHAVKQGFGEGLARALTAFLAQKNMGAASADAARTLGEYQQGGRDEVARLMQQPNRQQAIAEALISRFPQAQQWGAGERKVREDRLTRGADVLGKEDPKAAIAALTAGQLPGQYEPPTVPEPTFGAYQGNTYALTKNRKGEPTIKFAPKETRFSVENKVPGMELQTVLGDRSKDLEGWKTRARSARELLDANTSAIEAIQQGAQSGGLEGVKQSLRKVLQGFGVTLPETAPTEQLQMALGQQILAHARKLAPVTAEDVRRLETILGSINTDPQALQKALSLTSAIALRDIQDFQRYLGDSEANASHPLIRNLYPGQGIGLELPGQLPGGTQGGMAILQELQKRGGDVSQFQVGGEQIPANARFDLRGGQPFTPAPAPAAPPGTLTPEQEQRRQELRKKLGIR